MALALAQFIIRLTMERLELVCCSSSPPLKVRQDVESETGEDCDVLEVRLISNYFEVLSTEVSLNTII
jgi:hypothetical protein